MECRYVAIAALNKQSAETDPVLYFYILDFFTPLLRIELGIWERQDRGAAMYECRETFFWMHSTLRSDLHLVVYVFVGTPLYK